MNDARQLNKVHQQDMFPLGDGAQTSNVSSNYNVTNSTTETSTSGFRTPKKLNKQNRNKRSSSQKASEHAGRFSSLTEGSSEGEQHMPLFQNQNQRSGHGVRFEDEAGFGTPVNFQRHGTSNLLYQQQNQKRGQITQPRPNNVSMSYVGLNSGGFTGPPSLPPFRQSVVFHATNVPPPLIQMNQQQDNSQSGQNIRLGRNQTEFNISNESSSGRWNDSTQVTGSIYLISRRTKSNKELRSVQ